MWCQTTTGSGRSVSVSGEPVSGADGSFLGYDGVGRDVSAQKRAEQMLTLEHEVARSLSAAEDAESGLQSPGRAGGGSGRRGFQTPTPPPPRCKTPSGRAARPNSSPNQHPKARSAL